MTPAVERLAFDRARDLQEHLDYAVDLGADVVQHPARDLVAGLVELGKSLRVTHVVLGREARPGLAGRLAPSLPDQLLRLMPEIEVHLVGEGAAPALTIQVVGVRRKRYTSAAADEPTIGATR